MHDLHYSYMVGPLPTRPRFAAVPSFPSSLRNATPFLFALIAPENRSILVKIVELKVVYLPYSRS